MLALVRELVLVLVPVLACLLLVVQGPGLGPCPVRFVALSPSTRSSTGVQTCTCARNHARSCTRAHARAVAVASANASARISTASSSYGASASATPCISSSTSASVTGSASAQQS